MDTMHELQIVRRPESIYKNNHHKLHTQKNDLVVGIPRSGIIPAYMIALNLNIDCIDPPSFIKN